MPRSVRADSVYEQRPGAAGRPLPDGYLRRTPERTVLYELVSAYREPMLRHMREVAPKGYGLPRHVDRELEAFLRCGILAHGFTRVRCATCHDEMLVAFSCKCRGLCPSCTSRRMADAAAHLVDRIFPRARYRQWVFTVPKSLRLRLAREPAWANWVNQLIVRAIAVWQRRAARALGVRDGQNGAITFVQRFGGILNLNVHYHLVVPDGVFVADDAGELSLQELRGPTDDELLAILDRVADRIGERLADEAGRRGDAADDDDADMPPDLWSQLQAESSTTWRSPPRPSQPAASVWRARRVPWADLLKRVFADDLLNCACGGRRTVLALVTDARSARTLLDGLGLPHRPTVFAPRGPPVLFHEQSPAFEPDPPAPGD